MIYKKNDYKGKYSRQNALRTLRAITKEKGKGPPTSFTEISKIEGQKNDGLVED